MTFIQIGTKDGNDDFNLKVRNEKPSLVILVEPNGEHYESIYSNYEDIGSLVYIEIVAITAEPANNVTLVRPAVPVNGIEFDSGKFSLLPMDDWGDDFVQLKVPALTFNQLCSKYGVRHVDYLQIDTEGYDSEIIKSINFDAVTIDCIKYEQWNFSPGRFTRHGDKGLNYGTEGMRQVEQLLTSKGYVLEKLPYDIIARRG